ncbi:hypothetical protein OS493_019817 [Desmophyllum pertusum]|uniref:Uncharacterized protein n=1 Tax=Desmophyllum pertusum TaxID=174260 RepID=A0A9W9Z376_9CNID|nr:hypothetical protein OS493_019817 [Desmophyllum pertusum]
MIMATSSTSTSGTVGQLSKPEYRNWLALGHALTTVLCQGLRPFINREVETFYRNVSARIGGPCTCVHVPRRRPNEYHDMSTCAWATCAWANILQAYHHRNKPNWKQSDSTKWIDPILGPWEIAKLFLPDLGAGHAGIKSADDMDITGILNLMYWCNHFTIPQPLINEVRETRNNKWVHVPKLELSNIDKTDAFDAIENLLKDPQLAPDADAQKALREIVNLKTVSDWHSLEAQVLADVKEMLKRETQQSERTQKEVGQLVLLVEKRLEVLEQRNGLLSLVGVALQSLHGNLVRSVKGIRKGTLVSLVMMFLFCSFCVILEEDTFIRDGCSIQMNSYPRELKYFDFSDFIKSSRAEFIGRQWLYQEMESILNHTSKRGVLITGNPGSGKSAFLSNLLCSNTSSPIIHNRILGYHFCMHFNKRTKSGADFVQSLANMIAWRIMIEYRQDVWTDSYVSRVLYKYCPQDPEWCFEQGILIPLKKLQNQPTEPWYIVIDAIDECADAKAEIPKILQTNIRRFPKWLRLIVSSRNVSTIVTSLNELQRVDLRSDDKRNLDDIDAYIFQKVFPLKESIVQRIKMALAITDNDASTQKIVSHLATKGQGNFQFVKVVLDLWLASAASVKWDTFPKTLDSSYQLYFERKYGTPESFQSLRQIFEVLVAAYTPLTVHEMHSLLRIDHPTLDLEYDFLPKLDQVSLFLWHGSGDGLIRIYHASLSEWLTSETNKGKFYYIKKQNGHNRLANYYLNKAITNNSLLKPDEAFHLASHIVEGGLVEFMVQQFLSLPSDHINTTDPVTHTTALHRSSSSFNADVTKLLIHHFSDVDCLDNDQRTPSFIAATSGHLNNLEILLEKGANLNHSIKYADVEIASYSQDPINECKRKLCEYSLLHTAAQEGNVDVVHFLIRHDVNILSITGVNNTAVQLAAANGHLETVQTLKRAGGVLEGISLHHAAAGGHSHVVQYLLREGIKDTCVHSIPFPMFSDRGDKELKAAKVRLYDNRHLYLRETALHAAVRRGHISVIKSLLSENQSAISCANSAGRRPLHEAVRANSYNTLEALLATGANASVPCDTGISSSMQFEPFVPDKVAKNHCPCGFSPLHIAAMYGYHSAAKLLIKYRANVNAGDCTGSSPLHIASCHGILSLVTLLVKRGANINAASLNGSTPLHSAAACFAKTIFHPLFELGCDHYTTDNEGMTALHYVVKDIDVVGSECLVDLYARQPKDWIETDDKGLSQLSKKNEEYPWLHALIELVICSATTRISQDTMFISMIDKKNETVWHTLAQKTNVSSVLLGRNGFGGGRFVLLLTPFGFAYDFTINEMLKSEIKQHESIIIPRSIMRFLVKTLFTMFPESTNCSFLLHCVTYNLVRSINTALQVGLDVNCRDVSGLTPLLVYLRTGGRHMSKVLVKHNVEVEITCGDTFENSVFHLASYHKLHYVHYLNEFLLGSDNWQKYLQTENAIFDYFVDKYDEENHKGSVEMIRTGDGPLSLAILSHPKGIKVIDECFDAEGYNALHRAAQGANLIAIKKFISLEANPFINTSKGLSSLWLSVLYAVKYRAFLNLDIPSVLTALEVELASLSASTLLSHVLRYTSLNIGCDGQHPKLTLYHIAASRGMWKFVDRLLSEKKVVGIDVNCPNRDGITPMYLAKVFGGDSCEWDSPWCKVADVIKSHGGILQYPTFEAEYFLINTFHKRFASTFDLHLTEQEIITLQQGNDCQKYGNATAFDLRRAYDDIDRVHNDYQVKSEECVAFKQDCPTENIGFPHLTYVLLLLDGQSDLKNVLFLIQRCFSNFLDNELEQVRGLLLNTIKSHSELSTENILNSSEFIMSTIQLKAREDPLFSGVNKCIFGKENMGLGYTYSIYKRVLDSVLEDSDEVKSVIRRTLPRFLANMTTAFHNFDMALNCDWQAVAIKYVQLEFYLRNLQQIWIFPKKSIQPGTSDFISGRMKTFFLHRPKDVLKLMLRWASEQPSDTFRYLDILTFKKPPLWENKDKTFFE